MKNIAALVALMMILTGVAAAEPQVSNPNISPQQPPFTRSQQFDFDLASAGDDAALARLSKSLDPSESKMTENEKQVEMLVNQGIERKQAEKIANGFIVPITNPVTGLTDLVDITTGEAVEITRKERPATNRRWWPW